MHSGVGHSPSFLLVAVAVDKKTKILCGQLVVHRSLSCPQRIFVFLSKSIGIKMIKIVMIMHCTCRVASYAVTECLPTTPRLHMYRL